mmetsp:Transcript_2476/g.5411  ORF Transcript_2476/g.5411 Transcript_2476/m.5411 type:complete len:474 (-) Transcript_2476:843-2264(-)|eukprot:CAMPEP_0168171520 /NCGR_PEP_ID=MMETSP0139_2-20121125/4747_1 /TAXON_ID=44445 /ORGANISM="Pseudo-nitzschia australis, Strain 10249 10 AB" /LENGTH=473 /DNA_ID=CAMNT_0008089075 /DNA_START=166 /DNA_END=1587 /DNA_ORIENTATION=-
MNEIRILPRIKTKRRYHHYAIVPCILFSCGTAVPANGFFFAQPRPTSWMNHHYQILRRESRVLDSHTIEMSSNEEKFDGNDDDSTDSSLIHSLMKLASAHCASQALHTAVQLEIPDILDEKQRCCSIDELCEAVTAAAAAKSASGMKRNCNRDALLRTMRLLTTIDIVREEKAPSGDATEDTSASFCFSLTKLGKCLRTTPATGETSMAPCVSHWMEAPLWDAWLGLPAYIREGESSALPFERANGGVSSDFWYNKDDHPESLGQANAFVKLIHEQEIEAVAKNFDWSFCRGKRLVDVGGHNGLLAAAIARREPTIDCYCLDLPEVIAGVQNAPEGITMVPGNVFEPATIPPCEVILMKHFCDRCMWDETETVNLLRSCRSALLNSSSSSSNTNDNESRRIIIADAVLPNCGCVDERNELALYLDALYMLVGRERQRTKMEWEELANSAGLDLVGVESTSVPSCSLIILEARS